MPDTLELPCFVQICRSRELAYVVDESSSAWIAVVLNAQGDDARLDNIPKTLPIAQRCPTPDQADLVVDWIKDYKEMHALKKQRPDDAIDCLPCDGGCVDFEHIV